MKKLFTMMSMAAIAAMTMAQSVTTHSVYDVNQNGEINVADAVTVAQAVLREAAPGMTPQYVTAEDLSTMFSTILTKLESIESRLSALESSQSGGNGSNDPYNGHEYVDLGVVVDGKPVYWATTNIGAEVPADYGLYFAWGETVGYGSETASDGYTTTDGHKFDWVSYSSDLCGGGYDKMKKYCTDSKYGTVDNKTVLDPEDDAAHVNWQGAWRMPTKAEQDALRAQCTWTWTTMTNSAGKSINGYKVSNKTDSSKFIFLPAAGYRSDDYLSEVAQGYWSSSLYASNSRHACCLDFTSSYYDWATNYRCCGQSVRPVCQ